MAEPLRGRTQLRRVHRQRGVRGARVPGHRVGVCGRAGAVPRGSGSRPTLPQPDRVCRGRQPVRRHRHTRHAAVQRQPVARGQERVCGHGHGSVRASASRPRAARAPVRVPRIHIRVGHHHIRVHPQLQALSRV